MSTLMAIVKEEKERLERLVDYYHQKLSELPRGYLSRKKISGKTYCYRSFRSGKTVKTIYLGNKESEAVKKFVMQLSERKKLEKLLKASECNLREAKRMLSVGR